MFQEDSDAGFDFTDQEPAGLFVNNFLTLLDDATSSLPTDAADDLQADRINLLGAMQDISIQSDSNEGVICRARNTDYQIRIQTSRGARPHNRLGCAS